MKNKVLIGQTECNELIEADINEDGTIRGFTGYDIVDKSNSYDENYYLSMSSWCHKVTVNNITYRTDEKLPANLVPYWIDTEYQEVYENKDFYYNEGLYCCECGKFHDSEQYYDISYKVVGCEIYCNNCIPADKLLCEVNIPSDFFQAPDVSNMEISEDFEEVETLFCDSSGFGSSSERALTKEQATKAVEKIISDNEDNQLYAGITNAGQFQVYVTIYKKVA